MPLQYINELLELPELQLHSVLSIHPMEVHLEASPVAHKQPCPICHFEQAVKRDGRNKPRKIRLVSVIGKKCFLHIPSLHLFGRIRLLSTRNNTAGFSAHRP
jgi:transposase